MKLLILVLATFFAVNSFAVQINCITKLSKQGEGEAYNTKYCGNVEVKAFNDGIKYRRRPRFCSNIMVEFYSIKPNDAEKFTRICDNNRTKSCYFINVVDTATHYGMGTLSANLVVPNAESIPSVFKLGASGTGVGSPMSPAAKLVWLDLKCRTRP